MDSVKCYDAEAYGCYENPQYRHLNLPQAGGEGNVFREHFLEELEAERGTRSGSISWRSQKQEEALLEEETA